MTPVRDSIQLGATISRLRTAAGLSQEQLARSAGVLQKTVSAIEHGESGTQLKTLFKVLAALNLEVTIKNRSK